MNVYDHMLALLRRYHTNAEGERLAGEMLIEGYNVVSDFLRLEVGAPWVWSARMEEFYRVSDAFVYELLVWHHKPSRIAWRAEVADLLKRRYPAGGSILCLGDGIGYDSLSIALNLPDAEVTSFELPGHSSAFAARLHDDAARDRRIALVNDPHALLSGVYDAVLSFHVLEHLPAPLTMVRDIATYLKPGGCALIAEAFTAVEPSKPTHLAANLQYGGRTIAMFEQQGLAFEGMLPNWIYIFRKGAGRHPLRHFPLRARYRLAGLIAAKRFARDYPEGSTDLKRVLGAGLADGCATR
ncbi:MAG TPA: methyltransferase domain-containing protein [Candidatus Binataceae bacterium]|nr:methyltransferase domain-containing protein [Candidatus Binataceae bacterium]